MLVPTAMEQLNETHAAFGKSSRQKAIGGVGARLARFGPVEVERRVRLLRQIRQLRHRTSACGTPFHIERCVSRFRDRRILRNSSSIQLAKILDESAARPVLASACGIREIQHGSPMERNFTP